MLNAKTMLTNISRGQSSIPLRYIISGLESDYNKLKNAIQLIYVTNQNGKTMVYFKVPSTNLANLWYDCVFEFETTQQRITSTTNFKVYCNSPSFYYRYANIFKRYGSLLYPEKYPSFLDIPAEVRNKSQVTGFDKYVYSCLRIVTQLSVDDMKQSMRSQSEPRVTTFNEKVAEHRRLEHPETADQD